jgi:hypothetical protein
MWLNAFVFPQVDAPGVDESGYEESAAALKALIAGENVTLAVTEAGPTATPTDVSSVP